MFSLSVGRQVPVVDIFVTSYKKYHATASIPDALSSYRSGIAFTTRVLRFSKGKSGRAGIAQDLVKLRMLASHPDCSVRALWSRIAK